MSTTRPYRGLSAEERTARRRTLLLEAGLELLGTAGYDKTTMTAVCTQANLTERYFYESFSSREQLLLSVVDQVADEVRATVLAAVESAPSDPYIRARKAISAFVELLTTDPRKGHAAIVAAAAVEPLRRRRQELLREFADLIVTQARSVYGPKAHTPPRDRINALLFVGGLAELLTAWLSGELDAGTEDIIDVATSQLAAASHR